ncbi:MAG: tRNA-dihydrouridine synthase, partial [Saprospiraceae bacterium]
IGNPWIFREIKHYLKTGEELDPPTLKERLEATAQHLKHSIEWKGEKLGVLEMRRHYTNYFKGLAGIKEHRSRLVSEMNPSILYEILEEIEEAYSINQLETA